MSDKQLQAATQEAGASSEVTQAALDANAQARLDGLRAGLTVLILIAALALFFVGRMPTRGPGSEQRGPPAPTGAGETPAASSADGETSVVTVGPGHDPASTS